MKPGEFEVVRLFRGPDPGIMQDVSDRAVSYWRNQVAKGVLCGVQQNFFSILTVWRPEQIVGCSVFLFDSKAPGQIDPATFFKPALDLGMSGIVVVRNDPGNSTEPGEFDRVIVRELLQLSETLDVELFDYVILGESTAVSLRKGGHFGVAGVSDDPQTDG